MELPRVKINVGNGNLGRTPSTNDGVVGMILSGIATAGIELQKPKVIYGLKEAEDLGLADSPEAYSVVKEFYNIAGDGAELWLMLVAKTVPLAEMTDKSGPYAPALIAAADRRIRMLVIDRVPDDAYTPDQSDGIDKDVYFAMTNAQSLANEETEKINPIRIVIGGRAFSGDIGKLKDLKKESNNRVQILMGASSDNGRPAVGLLAGTYARVPVQRNPGRVKNGSLPINAAYFTDGSSLSENQNKVAALHDKGYVAIRNFIGKAGFYFTDDPTATANTDDYSSFALGRVIDKAYLLCYQTYVDELNDEIAVEEDGTISPGRLKELQAKIENAINGAMTSNEEISSVEVEIDPKQNVLSTDRIEINLAITPVGYMKQIVVNLGFQNPFNS